MTVDVTDADLTTTFTFEEDALRRAHEMVRQAFDILRQAVRASSPHTGAPTRSCADMAIRSIVGLLAEQAEEFGLPADLLLDLWNIEIGNEPELPDDLRKLVDEERLLCSCGHTRH